MDGTGIGYQPAWVSCRFASDGSPTTDLNLKAYRFDDKILWAIVPLIHGYVRYQKTVKVDWAKEVKRENTSLKLCSICVASTSRAM